MSGFLDRLAARGRGGEALAPLSIVKPVAAIYGVPARAEEAAPETIDALDAPARLHEDDAGRATPSRDGPGTPLTPTPARAADPAPVASAWAVERPEQRTARVSTDADRPPAIETRSGETSTKAERYAAPPAPQRTDSPRRRADEPARGNVAAPALAVEADADPAAAANRPRRPQIGLERLFDAIEAAEEHPSPMTPSVTDALHPRQAEFVVPAPEDGGPLVSIGRISISVAPQPPPASVSGPARNYGFQAYSRLRRGIER